MNHCIRVFVGLAVFANCEVTAQAQASPANVLRYANSDYGRAMDARQGGIVIDSQLALGNRPLTIEVRVKIMRRNFFYYYVIASADGEQPVPAWELSMQERKGIVFSIGAWTTAHAFDLRDDGWHDITVRMDASKVEVYVDGDKLGTSPIPGDVGAMPAKKLWVGQSSDGARTCEGFIDDLRISSQLKPVRNAWSRDRDTIVYLDFEESDSEFLEQWTPVPSTRQGTDDWELESDRDWMDERFQTMERGTFFSNSTRLQDRRVGPKNITVDLGRGAHVMFDTQRCVTVAGLTDAEVSIHPQRFGILHQPEMQGDEEFYVDALQAWRRRDPQTDQPRDVPIDEIQYGGLYRHERGIVLRYRVTDTSLLELHSADEVPNVGHVFCRSFQSSSDPDAPRLRLCVGQWETAKRTGPREVLIPAGDRVQAVRVEGNGELTLEGHRVFLSIPNGEAVFQVFVWDGAAAQLAAFRRSCATQPTEKLKPMTRGSRRVWGEPLSVQSTRAEETGDPYVVDDIGMPYENEHGALMFAAGFDFFPSGVAAVCTVHGDVWLVRGIDQSLRNVTWQRFATGLYQPLGLKVVNDVVYVLGRDQITKLHDLNQDGEADYYENFNNDLVISGEPHAYAMCLETDPQGNFYFFKSGRTPPHGSTLVRVSPDGSRLDVFASGYRHPNGLAVGPEGTVTAADNQGNWIPTSSIQIVEEGSFHGYEPHRLRPRQPDRFAPPLCWIPHFVDNSSGGQVWCKDDRFGPFRGDLLHLSWGRCSLHLVMRQRVDQLWQGGTVQFPNLRFASGPARARFNLSDGHLYVCGLDGWQTGADRDGCFQRVRYTGRDVLMPKTINAHRNGIHIKFTHPINAAAAARRDNYTITQWQYQWTEEYGSSEFSIVNPNRVAHDSVDVSSISIAPDGTEVFLEIPSIAPVMQMHVDMSVETTDGKPHTFSVYNTIHQLAETFAPRW